MTQGPDTLHARDSFTQRIEDDGGAVVSFWGLVFLIAWAADATLKATGLIPVPWRWLVVMLLMVAAVALTLRRAPHDVKYYSYQLRYVVIFVLGCVAGRYFINSGGIGWE